MNLTSIVQPMTAGAIVFAAISMVAIPEALAQETNIAQSSPVQAVTGSVQHITLTMGKGGLFKTSAPYAKLSVADEKIVGVTPQSDREFIFNPKGIGSTNVFVFDEKNTLIARVDINVVGVAKAHEVREETGEGSTRVTVYNRIYDDKGSLAKPAFYQCSGTNCEIAAEAQSLKPEPTATTTMSTDGDAPTEGEKPQ